MPSSPTVPDDEIEFRTSRAGGPGGQSVNKRSSRVEARWNVRESRTLSGDQRRRVLTKLQNRIDKDGVLRVVAEDERSQRLNKELAVERLRQLVRDALRVPKPRKKTKPPLAAKERRLKEKRRRKATKETRRTPEPED